MMADPMCPHCCSLKYMIVYGETVYARCKDCLATGPSITRPYHDDTDYEVLGQKALEAWSKQPWHEAVMFMRNEYSKFGGRGCPACEYREGYFIRFCKLHEEMEELQDCITWWNRLWRKARKALRRG